MKSVMMMEQHNCLHEEQLNKQSREIERLSVHEKYKEQQINDINDKIGTMEEKIDNIDKNVNKLILRSQKGDSELEQRLTAIETELQVQKETSKEIADRNRADANLKMAVISIVIAVITFYFAYIR